MATTDGGGALSGRRPRLDDVAARVELSPATVSLVLRNAPGPSAKTRRRVLQAATELGYRPDRTASLLARRRSRLLGIMIDIRSPFQCEVVEDLYEVADGLGYDVVLSTVGRSRDEQRAVDTLLDSRCEALILLGPDTPAVRLAGLAERLPVIVVGRRLAAPGVDVVRSADDEGVGLAVHHLVRLGHREIAYLDGGKGTIAADRRRGYRRAMHRHRLDDHVRVLPGDHTEEAGRRAAAALLAEDEPPTAVVAFNDRAALGLLDAVTRAGGDIPRALSVVGYDDSRVAHLAHVNLTTVGQNARQQAEHAVAAAVERVEDRRTAPRDVVLPPQLVVRGTTGPPPRRSSRRRSTRPG